MFEKKLCGNAMIRPALIYSAGAPRWYSSVSYSNDGVIVRSRLNNAAAIMQGLWIGVCVFVGSLLSKRIILALPEKRFLQIMELTMLISGGLIVFMAVRAEIAQACCWL